MKANQMELNEQRLKALWNEYHELSQQRIACEFNGLDTSEIDAKWEQVCAEIEIISDRQV